MASLKGTNITAMDASPSTKVKSSEVHGRMRVAKDSYTAAGASIGDTITVARLPKGAVVYGVTVWHAALGTGVLLAAGDSGDIDRYVTAVASATAGKKLLTNSVGFAYEQTAETDVILTVSGAAATGLITTLVEYAVD